MGVKDTARSRVYEAEQLVRNVFDRADETGVRTVEIHGSRLTLPIERRFADLESVRTYLDKVLALNWIRARWPDAGVVAVRERAGATAAHYEADTATIAVPVRGGTWALREFVVLHELAHHVTPSVGVAQHGAEFCGAYLELVETVIGPEASFVLRTSLHACGVALG